MALPIDPSSEPRDPRALKILAKSIYKELRTSGYEERDVMAFAGELLGLVSREVRERRESEPPRGDTLAKHFAKHRERDEERTSPRSSFSMRARSPHTRVELTP